MWTACLCNRYSDRSNSAPEALSHLFRAYSSSSFPLSHGKILAGLPENLSFLAGVQSQRKANSTAGFRRAWKPSPKSTDSWKGIVYPHKNTKLSEQLFCFFHPPAE